MQSHLLADASRADVAPERDLADFRREHLGAIEEAVAAARAFRDAPAGERAFAHRRLKGALANQAAAEGAYERARQATRGTAYAGRHRMIRWP